MRNKPARVRRTIDDRYSEMKGLEGANIPQRVILRSHAEKGSDLEEIIQDYVNKYLKQRRIPFVRYSSNVLRRGGDASVCGHPDNMIRMPIKGTPFCLMLNIELKRRGKDLDPAQKELKESFNSTRVDDFEHFEKLMREFDIFHGVITRLTVNQ